MKIGIDAKWFYDGPASGRVVIRNLIKHISCIDTLDEFYIILKNKDKGKSFPYQKKNIHLTYVWGGNNMLSNVFIIPLSLRKLNLDIVIFQNFSSMFSNFRRYVFVHDILYITHPEFYTRIEKLYLSPLKILLRFAHGVCTVSETEKQRMSRFGYGNKAHIDVIYHGVDEAFIPNEFYDAVKLQGIVEKYNLPPKFILYVGRLNIRKNVLNLLRSLPLLNNTSIPLVIVGDYDWKMESLKGQIEKLGIANRVIFTGAVYGEDLPAIYAQATVFCFVSYAESFGLPALEAMASGVPIVVSNRTCLPEICVDAALYVDPDDPIEIAERIDQLLSNNSLWIEMKARGIMRSKLFSWEKSAEILLQRVSNTVLRSNN